MYTEDDVAAGLRSGAFSVDDVLKLFVADQVYVYEENRLDPQTATWEERDDFGAGGSALFHVLHLKKAQPEQVDEVKAGIRRAWDAGRTIQSLWPKS